MMPIRMSDIEGMDQLIKVHVKNSDIKSVVSHLVHFIKEYN